MYKKWICLVLATFLVFPLCGCRELSDTIAIIRDIRGDDSASKEEIIRFVSENEEYILQCIQQRQPETLEGYSIIHSVYEADSYIEFFCGGAGFASQTDYTGFIYSKNGNMNAARPDIMPEYMTPDGDGYYWKEENGDDTYYIENITGRFYYYREHY